MYFSAKLIFESNPVAHGEATKSVEERIVLIEACDESDAQEKANLIGKCEEFSYEAADGGTVIVSFLGVRNVFQLTADTIGHGTEIYSESKWNSFG